MRQFARLVLASVSGLPLLAGTVSAQGRDLMIDFHVTESGTSRGVPVNGVGTGHGVMSNDRVRFDMKGNTQMMKMPGGLAGDAVTFILLDSGKTIIFLQPKTKQYMRFRPAEMMDGMQKMMEGIGASIPKIVVTGDDPKVENLGAGPTILGHHTVHYRVTGHTKVSMAGMGPSQQIESSSVDDAYMAPDLSNFKNPFRGLPSDMMGGVFGASMKTYMEKMQAAKTKITGFPLRFETHGAMTAAGQTSDTKTVNEITRVEYTTASPSLFEVPADYALISFPMMNNRSRGATPPVKH